MGNWKKQLLTHGQLKFARHSGDTLEAVDDETKVVRRHPVCLVVGEDNNILLANDSKKKTFLSFIKSFRETIKKEFIWCLDRGAERSAVKKLGDPYVNCLRHINDDVKNKIHSYHNKLILEKRKKIVKLYYKYQKSESLFDLVNNRYILHQAASEYRPLLNYLREFEKEEQESFPMFLASTSGSIVTNNISESIFYALGLYINKKKGLLKF